MIRRFKLARNFILFTRVNYLFLVLVMCKSTITLSHNKIENLITNGLIISSIKGSRMTKMKGNLVK